MSDALAHDPQLPLVRLTRDRFDVIVESGALDDRPAELLEGYLVARSTGGVDHARVAARLGKALTLALGPQVTVRQAAPLAVSARSLPYPDIAVVDAGADLAHDYPTTAHLVVEVADTSHQQDLAHKPLLYAAAGVPVYWVVDIPGDYVVVHDDLVVDSEGAPHYGSVVPVPSTATLPVLGVPVDLGEATLRTGDAVPRQLPLRRTRRAGRHAAAAPSPPLVPVPARLRAPVRAPTPAPAQAPTPAPAQAPTPAPVHQAPAPTPLQAPTPAPVQAGPDGALGAPVTAPASGPRHRRVASEDGTGDPVAGAVRSATGRPWATLASGGGVLVLAVLGLGAGLETTAPEDTRVGESGVAAAMLDGVEFGTPPTENVVVTPTDGAPLDPAIVAAVGDDLHEAVAGLDGVAGVGDPIPAPDGTAALVPVSLASPEGDTDAAAEAVDPMLEARADVDRAWPEHEIRQVGPGSLEVELLAALDADFRQAELLAIPVTLAVLLLTFGPGVAALVPVVVGLTSVVVAQGLTALVSQLFPVDQNTPALVLLIGLAVGVDYALFVLRRSREERAAGLAPRAAVAATGRTAVRSVVVSGTTVIVAMAGLFVAGGLYASLGVGAAVVVLASVVASVTVLPALLCLLGDRVDTLSLTRVVRRREPSPAGRAGGQGARPPSGRRARRRDGPSPSPAAEEPAAGPWAALASRVVRRPLAWGLVATAVLLALAAPALGMRTAIQGIDGLPQDFDTVQAAQALDEAFPTEGDTVDVVVALDEPAGPAEREAVTTALAAAHEDASALGAAEGDVDIRESVDGSTVVLALGESGGVTSEDAGVAVETVREDIVPPLEADLAAAGLSADVAVGGLAAVVDFTDWLDRRLPLVMAFVLVLTLVVMGVSFGSPWLAAATVGLNLLSVGAAYGVVTLVFQGTWAEGLLGFTSTGSIASWLPLMLFVILFGLSMDYHVFVVSRVREAAAAGLDPTAAVVAGVARSAGVVTSAAAIMVAVFAVFATLSILEMKQLGLGLAVAVLLDATVVRGLLLPAVLTVLGPRSHTGPRWLPALHG